MRHLPLKAACLLAAAETFAAVPPPTVPQPSAHFQATLHAPPSSGLTMGSLSVRFEQTSLADVLREAPAGALSHQGDAGGSIYWLCYTNLNATTGERIWIVSDGEMGGDSHVITGVIAQRLAHGRASADCPALPGHLKPLAFEHGIWLDTPADAVRRKLGAPSSHGASWEWYDYAGKVPGKCGSEGFDLTNALALRHERRRINFLQVRQVTSC